MYKRLLADVDMLLRDEPFGSTLHQALFLDIANCCTLVAHVEESEFAEGKVRVQEGCRCRYLTSDQVLGKLTHLSLRNRSAFPGHLMPKYMKQCP